MATFSDLIGDAQVILQDVAAERYTLPQLLRCATLAVAEAFVARPDFQFGQGYAGVGTYSAADTVPIPANYHSFIIEYIVFRAEIRDDEFANDGRAAAFLARFKNGLTAR